MNFNEIDNPKDLLEYMSKNIKYGFVGKNGKKYLVQTSEDWNDWYQECRVQTGEEVLNTNVGTCWDQVELERLWFEKNNYEIKTIFIWFEVEEEYSANNPNFPNMHEDFYDMVNTTGKYLSSKDTNIKEKYKQKLKLLSFKYKDFRLKKNNVDYIDLTNKRVKL